MNSIYGEHNTSKASITTQSLKDGRGQEEKKAHKIIYSVHNPALRIYAPLVQEGDDEAQYRTAEIHRTTIPHKAYRRFDMAAEQGHPLANCRLGELYLESKPPNYSKAIEHFKKADEGKHGLGRARALMQIGTIYYMGMGVTKDAQLGLEYLRKAEQAYQLIHNQTPVSEITTQAQGCFGVDIGDDAFYLSPATMRPIALCILGLHSKDRQTKQAYLNQAAEAGYDIAQYLIEAKDDIVVNQKSLGLVAELGKILDRRNTKGQEIIDQVWTYLKQLADEGNEDAAYEIAQRYENGDYFEKDKVTLSVEDLTIIRDELQQEGRLNLEVSTTIQEQIRFNNVTHASLKKIVALAQNGAGATTLDITFTKQDTVQAIAYFTLAADKGHANAALALGKLFSSGEYENASLAEKYLTQTMNSSDSRNKRIAAQYLSELYSTLIEQSAGTKVYKSKQIECQRIMNENSSDIELIEVNSQPLENMQAW